MLTLSTKGVLVAVILVLIVSQFTFAQVRKVMVTSLANYTLVATGSVYVGSGRGPGEDPACGLMMWTIDKRQDGSSTLAKVLEGTHYYHAQPDTVSFTGGNLELYLCVVQEFNYPYLEGEYTVTLNDGVKDTSYLITKHNVVALSNLPQVRKVMVAPGANYSLVVTGSMYVGSGRGSGEDPVCGLLMLTTDRRQDGSSFLAKIMEGTHYYHTQPDTVSFTGGNPELYLCVVVETEYPYLEGEYTITLNDGVSDTSYQITKDNVIALDQLVIDGLAVPHGGTAVPITFSLMQNYPNPFNPTTTIHYALPARSHVTLNIFNMLGQKVAELVNSVVEAGEHEVDFTAIDLASGVYFCRLIAGSNVATNKMILAR